MTAWVGGTKQPPYSIHAEKALLGACLAHAGLLDRVRDILPSGEAFFRAQHGHIYDTMLALERADAVDREALAAALMQRDRLDEVGGRGYLVELQQVAATAENAVDLARQVQEKASLRRLIDVASDVLSEAYGGGAEYTAILKRARERLDELQPRPVSTRPKRPASTGSGTTAKKPAARKQTPSKKTTTKKKPRKPERDG